MIRDRAGHYPLEPRVGIRDYRFLGRTTWEDLDRKASELLGIECLAVPSVRVGMCWVLEYLGCVRHRDHVLVPRFMGRCILNSLNRHAMPVEAPSPQTRLAVVVHQYGLRQRLEAVQEECAERGLAYIEDSPYGLESRELLGPGSMAKFIGLTKVLPVLKGALAISEDRALLEFLSLKRREAGLWSWAVLGAMGIVRGRRKPGGYSALAEAAYEMYVESRGDNTFLRGNLLRSLIKLNSFATQAGQRLSMINDHIKERVLSPDTDRMPYAVPYFAGGRLSQAQDVFSRHGFDPGLYHVDLARNLFSPQYEQAMLIPLNPRIPFNHFEGLVAGLAALEATAPSETAGSQAVAASNP